MKSLSPCFEFHQRIFAIQNTKDCRERPKEDFVKLKYYFKSSFKTVMFTHKKYIKQTVIMAINLLRIGKCVRWYYLTKHLIDSTILFFFLPSKLPIFST